MLSAKNYLWAAMAILLTASNSRAQEGPRNFSVNQIHISQQQRVSPVGPRSLLQPTSGSYSYYYFFFHAAALTSVNHMESGPSDSGPHRLLYLETHPDGLLDRTGKSDLLLAGDFGTVYVDRTCFYNRPLTSYNSVSLKVFSNGYPSGYESPAELPGAPTPALPLTSIGLVRILRDEVGYTLAIADYEASGMIRNIQISKAKQGEVSTSREPIQISPGPDGKYGLNANDSRLLRYGIPFHFAIEDYVSSKHLSLAPAPSAEESLWLVLFYDFGKTIQQQQIKEGVVISSRWLRPSVTEEERQLGRECDSRFQQQRSMGLPTAGY